MLEWDELDDGEGWDGLWFREDINDSRKEVERRRGTNLL